MFGDIFVEYHGFHECTEGLCTGINRRKCTICTGHSYDMYLLTNRSYLSIHKLYRHSGMLTVSASGIQSTRAWASQEVDPVGCAYGRDIIWRRRILIRYDLESYPEGAPGSYCWCQWMPARKIYYIVVSKRRPGIIPATDLCSGIQIPKPSCDPNQMHACLLETQY